MKLPWWENLVLWMMCWLIGLFVLLAILGLTAWFAGMD